MHDKENISQHTRKDLFTGDFVLGVIAVFFFSAAFQSLTPTLPIYLTRLGSDEREIGVLIGMFAVASLVSRLFVEGPCLSTGKRAL